MSTAGGYVGEGFRRVADRQVAELTGEGVADVHVRTEPPVLFPEPDEEHIRLCGTSAEQVVLVASSAISIECPGKSRIGGPVHVVFCAKQDVTDSRGGGVARAAG